MAEPHVRLEIKETQRKPHLVLAHPNAQRSEGVNWKDRMASLMTFVEMGFSSS